MSSLVNHVLVNRKPVSFRRPHRRLLSPAAAAGARARMVDTESPICPLFPLEADDLESPLSEEFLQEMGNIQDISQSIGEDSSGSFSFTDYQYLGSGPGSDGSGLTGECAVSREASGRRPCRARLGPGELHLPAASFCPGPYFMKVGTPVVIKRTPRFIWTGTGPPPTAGTGNGGPGRKHGAPRATGAALGRKPPETR